MTRRGVLGAMATVGMGLIAGACGLLSSNSYRYRMTVEVDTPAGMRSGSSVMEITSRLQTNPGGAAPVKTDLKGEAVAVDLPDGRTLFALLRDGLAGDVTLAFEPGYRGRPEQFVASVEKLGRRDQRGRTAVLPPDKYPMLVTFRDINDPTSVQAVEPGNLAASFGPGVRLRRIMLEITGDGVSGGLEKRLPWLPAQHGSLVQGPEGVPIGDLPIGGRLNEGDFSQGLVT